VLTVRRGGAGGALAPATEAAAGVRQQGLLRLAELSGDGALDVVVAASGGVRVLLGRGDATFGPPVSLALGHEASVLATADLDGDGDLDLVAGPITLLGGPYGVGVFLNHGDGSFGARQDVPVGHDPCGLALGDLDGDARPDLALGFIEEGASAAILRNRGDGSFEPVAGALGAATEVAIVDLDGDGANDLVLASHVTGSQRLATAHGHGDGSFDAPRAYLAPYTIGPVALGDLDADGQPDLVLADGGDALVYRVHAGSLEDPVRVPAGDQAFEVALGDLDGDGLLDLVVAGQKGVATLVNASRP
jgi:hypothetical protein